MSEEIGCTDGGCIMVDDHSGMHTNGGCHCIENACVKHSYARPIRWRIMRLIAEREQVRRELAESNAKLERVNALHAQWLDSYGNTTTVQAIWRALKGGSNGEG